MAARIAVLIVLLVGLIGVLVAQAPRILEAINPGIDEKGSKPPTRPILYSLGEDESLVEALQREYRATPDNRFMLAIGQLHTLITGNPTTPAEAQWDGAAWSIVHLGHELGALPEVPDYPEWMALIEGYAAELLEKHPLNVESTGKTETYSDSRFLTSFALAALKRVDDSWEAGTLSDTDILAASENLVHLQLQNLDQLELADTLRAQSIAMAALLNLATEFSSVEIEALLSYNLGYKRYARERSLELPESNDARAYVHDDLETLVQTALNSRESSRARYLVGRRLYEISRVTDFRLPLSLWLQENYDDFLLEPGVLSLVLQTSYSGFMDRVRMTMPSLISERVEADLNGQVGGGIRLVDIREMHKTAVEALQQFGTADLNRAERDFVDRAANLETHYTGRVCPADLAQAYYNSKFYAARWEQSMLPRERQRPELDTDEDKRLREWRKLKKDWLSGKLPYDHAFNRFDRLDYLGLAVLRSQTDSFEQYTASGTTPALKYSKATIRRLDTRPEQMELVQHLLHSQALDIHRGYQLADRLADIADTPHWRRQKAYLEGDVDALFDVATDITAFSVDRCAALMNVQSLQGDELTPALEDAYTTLLEDHAEDWEARKQFIDLLYAAGRYDQCESIAQEFLDSDIPCPEPEETFAACEVARAYIGRGQYEEAWDKITPHIKAFDYEGYAYAVEIQQQLGKPGIAAGYAKRIFEKYTEYRNELDDRRIAQLYVAAAREAGRLDEAAAVLSAPIVRDLENRRLTDFGPVFVEVFSKYPPEKAGEAMATMTASGISSFELYILIEAMIDAGHYEHAYAAAEQIRPHSIERMLLKSLQMECVRELEGDEAAAEWKAQNVSANADYKNALVLYERGRFDDLWELIPRQITGKYSDFAWLLRASASVHPANAHSDKYADELRSYYESEADDSKYDTMGKYLIGMIGIDDVLAMIDNKQRMAEAAYYIALKAHSEGDYEAAQQWYRLSIESGSDRDREVIWSYTILRSWRDRAESPLRLSQSGM